MPYTAFTISPATPVGSVLGSTDDTAAFAVRTIRRWWHEVGSVQVHHPDAKHLLITADGGGSNGSQRAALGKRELQHLANEIGMDIVVHHLPPGTSKWNKIEHRLFSFITQRTGGRNRW